MRSFLGPVAQSALALMPALNFPNVNYFWVCSIGVGIKLALNLTLILNLILALATNPTWPPTLQFFH
jgi:hypothetical protein